VWVLDKRTRDINKGRYKMREITKEDIGRYVKFKPACRWGSPLTKRKITHVFAPSGKHCLGVTYNGCRPFYVHHSEIVEILA